MTNLEDMNREEENKMKAGLENPDNLVSRKDPVGDQLGGMQGEQNTSNNDSQKGGASEAPDNSQLIDDIKKKASQVEAAGGTRPDIIPSSYFKGKSESSLKEVLNALDKELEKALSAGSPEAMATALFWAVLGAPFSAANAWMEHRKKENKRLDKEYDEKIAAHDSELGVSAKDKFVLGWTEVIKDLPPEYQQYLDKDGRLDKTKMTKKAWDGLKKRVLKNANIRSALETKCERQIEDREWNKQVDDMFARVGEKTPERPKEEPKEPTISDVLKGQETTNALLKELVESNRQIMSNSQNQHATNQSYKKAGEMLEKNRSQLDRRLGKKGRIINGVRSFNQPHKNNNNGR